MPRGRCDRTAVQRDTTNETENCADERDREGNRDKDLVPRDRGRERERGKGLLGLRKSAIVQVMEVRWYYAKILKDYFKQKEDFTYKVFTYKRKS